MKKRLLSFACWGACLLSLAYLLPAGLLMLPAVQEKVRQAVRSELSNRLGVPVGIATLHLEWLNRLRLEKLTLDDRNGERLLEADYLSVGFQLLPLISGRLFIDALRLADFTLRLDREHTTGELNAQFLIDAFISRDTETEVDICLQSVLLRKGRITFASEGLEISGLAARFSLPVLRKDSILLHLDRLSFLEERGFHLQALKGNLSGNGKDFFANGIELTLPRSTLKIPQLTKAGTTFTLTLDQSDLCPADLAPFFPALDTFSHTVHFSASVEGQPDSLHLYTLEAGIGEDVGFQAELTLSHLRSDSLYLAGTVHRLFATPQGLSLLLTALGSDFPLPHYTKGLGTLSFSGQVDGTTAKLKACGAFTSRMGTLQTDVFIGKGTGNVAFTADGFARITSRELIAKGNGTLAFMQNGDYSGSLSAHISRWLFNGYDYTNISLNGDFRQNGFSGSLHIDDPNATAHLNGMFRRQQQNSVFDFTAHVRHLKSDRLHLTSAYSDTDLSFNLAVNLTGDHIDNAQGILRIDSLSLLSPNNRFSLPQLTLSADEQPSGRKLTLTSELINGELSGHYSFATLIPQFRQTLAAYLPAYFLHKEPLPALHESEEGEFNFLFSISNTETLSAALKLPFTVVEEARLSGFYNSRYDKFRLEAWLPKCRIGRSLVQGGYLSCENPYARIELLARATQVGRSARNFFHLKADAADDNLHASFNWSNNKTPFSGLSLSSGFLFSPDNTVEIHIHQSPLYINDTLWRIMPAHISLREDKVYIDHFSVEHNDLFFHLNGTLSHDLTDTLHLDLHQLELASIFDILNIPNLRFGGTATGSFLINDPYQSRILQTNNFTVENFSLNNAPLGRLNLHSHWDNQHQGIFLRGSIYNNDSTRTDVKGYIYPLQPHSGLSLRFNANDLNLAFLHSFFHPVLRDFSGRAFGPVHFFGPFTSLDLSGDAYVKDVRMTFDFLNTSYSFSDSVHLDTGIIRISQALLFDKVGNTALADFSFQHAFFKDFTFSADLHTDNFLAYDQSERTNPMIFGPAFGNGSLHIEGNNKRVDFDINMRSQPHTAVNFNFTHIAPGAENSFIRFVPSLTSASPPSYPTLQTADSLPTTDDDPVEIYVNLLLDITPDAILELAMASSGDRIRGRANGNILLHYNSLSDLRIYGNAHIVEGDYNFSLQQFIRRNFKIREGGSISFQGDPLQATLDLDAIYSLSANIGDLDPGLLFEADRTNVPVNCILSLQGALQQPLISFDIELPGSNTEIERQVRSFINTQSMMAQQIIYLMALNKFYTPSYSAFAGSGELSAVASATLSSQLSGLLNSISDKVQIGTNIYSSYDGMDDTEVEMLLSSQLLDNRLLFNGNFGYRNSYNLGKNVFVGEFDLEYKLTPLGEIRLKAYNHANDMYRYLTQSRTTQGFGILFKKDFTLLPELFRKRKRPNPTPQ
jgi:hypothetical protein